MRFYLFSLICLLGFVPLFQPGPEAVLPPSQEGPFETWSVRPPFPLNADTMLFLSDERALVFYSAAANQSIPLTPAGWVSSYTLSPQQKHIIVQSTDGKSYLLDIQPQPDQSLSIRKRLLDPAPESAIAFRFSPDETNFAYQDASKRVWVVDEAGNNAQLSAAGAVPAWSMDSRWLSYTTTGRELYIVEGQGTAQLVARNVDAGSQEWSSSHPLLAYTTGGSDAENVPFVDVDTRKLWVYDAGTGKSGLLKEGAGSPQWSPDGRVIAVQRIDVVGASGFSWTNFLVNPFSGAVHEVGGYHSRDAIRNGWLLTDQVYIFGAYRAEKDVSAVQRIAPVLLAAAKDGHTFLEVKSEPAGDIMLENIQVICWNDLRGERIVIAATQIGPLFGASMPGIWGQISDDGQWAVITYVQDTSLHSLLARCDSASGVEIQPAGEAFTNYTFSGNSRWLVGSQSQGDSGFSLGIYPLQENGVGQVVDMHVPFPGSFSWLKPVVFPAIPTPTPTPAPTATAAATRVLAVRQPTSAAVPGVVGPSTVDGLVRLLPVALALFGALIAITIVASIIAWWYLRRRQPRPATAAAPAAAKTVPRPKPELAEAIRLVRQGQYLAGYTSLQRFLEKNPDSGEAWYWMGAAAAGLQQPKTAERCYKKAKSLGYNPVE